MARKKRKRSGLGSAPEVHARVAMISAKFAKESARKARAAITKGDCTGALYHLLGVSRMEGRSSIEATHTGGYRSTFRRRQRGGRGHAPFYRPLTSHGGAVEKLVARFKKACIIPR